VKGGDAAVKRIICKALMYLAWLAEDIADCLFGIERSSKFYPSNRFEVWLARKEWRERRR